jgi:hypothetical protein
MGGTERFAVIILLDLADGKSVVRVWYGQAGFRKGTSIPSDMS